MPRDNKIISAKDIINTHSLSYNIVNHYTDCGLLPVLKKSGNVRFYDKEVVGARLKMIKELTEKGYTLRLIQQELSKIRSK